jgi:hypothetical protein
MVVKKLLFPVSLACSQSSIQLLVRRENAWNQKSGSFWKPSDYGYVILLLCCACIAWYVYETCILCLKYRRGYVDIRYCDTDRYVIIRKLLNSVFQYAMATKIAIPEISLNTEDFPSTVLPIQGVTYPQICFRQRMILPLTLLYFTTLHIQGATI